MSKLLTVFGATGQQGSSVVDAVVNDPQLSSEFAVRAITRTLESQQARTLMAVAEVVRADTDDRPSLKAALAGTHTVFAMTAPTFKSDGFDIEFEAAKSIADAAVEAGVQFIIFSTLPSVAKISQGKYTQVQHFEAKHKAEQYIKTLPIQSAFISPGFFMENFNDKQKSFLVLEKKDHGWILKGLGSPETAWPLVAARDDVGKFVGAILASPELYKGKTLYAATKQYTMADTARILSQASGRQIVYEQLSEQQFKDMLPGQAELFYQAFAYGAEFGYYGHDSAQLVDKSASEARGRLTTFEEYLQKYPLDLA